MSLIVAAAGAVVGGMVIKDYVFNYTKDEYESKISELTNLVARLNNHLTELENLKSEIPSFWDDDKAKKAFDAITLTIQRTKDNMQIAQRTLDQYKQIVADLDNSQGTLGDLLEGAVGLLQSIVV
ncbi:MAG: hypothetical protein E7455_07020 [Ruminococcaceae bacterium]|nr:hypothetical protein [Oscillospiraceae bacterium]